MLEDVSFFPLKLAHTRGSLILAYDRTCRDTTL